MHQNLLKVWEEPKLGSTEDRWSHPYNAICGCLGSRNEADHVSFEFYLLVTHRKLCGPKGFKEILTSTVLVAVAILPRGDVFSANEKE